MHTSTRVIRVHHPLREGTCRDRFRRVASDAARGDSTRRLTKRRSRPHTRTQKPAEIQRLTDEEPFSDSVTHAPTVPAHVVGTDGGSRPTSRPKGQHVCHQNPLGHQQGGVHARRHSSDGTARPFRRRGEARAVVAKATRHPQLSRHARHLARSRHGVATADPAEAIHLLQNRMSPEAAAALGVSTSVRMSAADATRRSTERLMAALVGQGTGLVTSRSCHALAVSAASLATSAPHIATGLHGCQPRTSSGSASRAVRSAGNRRGRSHRAT